MRIYDINALCLVLGRKLGFSLGIYTLLSMRAYLRALILALLIVLGSPLPKGFVFEIYPCSGYLFG
jgi:hypothetical protein